MAEFTLLELHFEDSDLTANAPYSRGREKGDVSDDSPAEGDSSNRGALLAALIGLGFCVAVAYLVRTRLFDDSEGYDY